MVGAPAFAFTAVPEQVTIAEVLFIHSLPFAAQMVALPKYGVNADPLESLKVPLVKVRKVPAAIGDDVVITACTSRIFAIAPLVNVI